MIAAIIQRLKLAFRTNDAQVEAVMFLSAYTVFAALISGGSSWLVIASALIWPAIAFAINLICPLR